MILEKRLSGLFNCFAIFTQFVLIIVSMIRKFCFQIKHTLSNYRWDGFVSETFGSSTAVSLHQISLTHQILSQILYAGNAHQQIQHPLPGL